MFCIESVICVFKFMKVFKSIRPDFNSNSLKLIFKSKVIRFDLFSTQKFNHPSLNKNSTNVGLECSVASYSHSPSVHSVRPALSALQSLS